VIQLRLWIFTEWPQRNQKWNR